MKLHHLGDEKVVMPEEDLPISTGGEAIEITLVGGPHNGETTIMPAECQQWQCGQCGAIYG